MIVGENILQGGRVYDNSYIDFQSEKMLFFNQRIANDPNLESIILPVGQGLSI
ncbi:hypothetical protein I7822_06515 [Metabacillus sp. BG109]|uniref:Uncharacterized protein n=1 Tax=Metabacillus bambusae TaxID=2795218 RepID=A0ABS3MZ78_9BACI|nr:hypothetical protein [Metabacillus bambusae]